MKNPIFIDIETAPIHPTLEEYPAVLRDKLVQKYGDEAYDKAGLHAEYAKIVCVSAGYFDDTDRVVTKSFVGHEASILTEIAPILSGKSVIVGHNIKEFDVPFIQRRSIINAVAIPPGIATANKKPWELTDMMHDTMEMWSSTQWKYRVSLNVLCELLGVESPKTDMDGSMVGKAFYAGEIHRIAEYCESDVRAVANVYSILSRFI